MIRLDVEDRCHKCPEFSAQSDTQIIYANEKIMAVETRVFCGNHRLCEHIKDVIMKEEKSR